MRQGHNAPWNPLVLYSHAAEQDGAGVAGAEQLSSRRLDEVRVIGTNLCAAQLAELCCALARPDELAKRFESILGSRLNCLHC